MMRLFFTFLLLVFFTSIFSQPGQLDSSFGKNGIVSANIGNPFLYGSVAKQILPLGDGGFFMIIETSGTSVITKKKWDGSTDFSYGTNGFSAPVAILFSHAALQPNGKIVIAGEIQTSRAPILINFGLARYNIDGSLDNTFGSGGIVETDFGTGGFDNISSVALQADGKILVVGTGIDFNQTPEIVYLELARYNIDGSEDLRKIDSRFSSDRNFYPFHPYLSVGKEGKLFVVTDKFLLCYDKNFNADSSFNVNGVQNLPGLAQVAAIQNNGKIVVGGTYNNQFCLSRYNVGGTLDNSFGINGVQLTSFGTNMDERITAICIQQDQKIIACGYLNNNQAGLARFDTAGILDKTFFNFGKQISSLNASSNNFPAIAIKPNGNLILVSYLINSNDTTAAAAQYTNNGFIDNTFGHNGIIKNSSKQSSTFFTSTVVQNNGKVLAAGCTWNGYSYDFLIVRYNLNGSADSSFSKNGVLTIHFDSTNAAVNAIAIQTDGKIVAAGYSGNNFAILRFDSSGKPDNLFGKVGQVITNVGFAATANSLAIKPDGKIVVGGTIVAVYNANGTIDNSFGEQGILNISAQALAVQPNGQILINSLNGLERFNVDGKQDFVFGSNGSKGGEEICTAIKVLKDGKIVVGGYSIFSDHFDTYQFKVERYNNDGSNDTTFNGGVLPVHSSPGNSFTAVATSLLVQHDNKIILGGYIFNSTGSNDFALQRYNANGTLDNTFNGNGTVITKVSGGNDMISGLALANDKFYAVGTAQFPGNVGIIARYLIDSAKVNKDSTPLVISSFSATAQNNNKHILLQWKSDLEHNTTNYIIERSNDNKVFKSIGLTKAKGNSNVAAYYSFTDEQPLDGINFYRLKITGTDFKCFYSKTVSAVLSLKNCLFTIFPNPAKNTLFVQTSGNDIIVKITIENVEGKKWKEIVESIKGSVNFSIDISTLPKGIYFFHYKLKGIVESIQFIKE